MQKSGWLLKKSSGFLSRWQTRFVIIWDGFITIKHVPNKNKCKQFETISAAKEDDEKTFSVHCKDGKRLFLQCNSGGEREDWIDAILRRAAENLNLNCHEPARQESQEHSNVDREQEHGAASSRNLQQTPLEPQNSVISRNGREFRSLRYPSGQVTVFQGSESISNRWGYGDFKYHNGNSYSGSFVADNKEGFGKFIWNNGDMYEGSWFQDEMSGNGTIKYINGNTKPCNTSM
eukprot:764352-Hanusia_phi.AAC.5